MIKLINGSVFDAKCDLIVIPCDHAGGLTSFVAHAIESKGLPIHRTYMQPGDVAYYSAQSNFANASVIAYAASVDALQISSNEDILFRIAGSIRDYCKANSLHIVNIPLLGTGAGRIAPEISYGILKRVFEREKSIQADIYVISKKSYALLKDIEPANDEEEIEIRPPRVFISYTGVDPENGEWVKSFACKLRENGVDARIDVFHLKPGQDLPQWMTNEILMADKILIICDKYYASKADHRKGGVGWETMVIQGDMLMNAASTKHICIVVDKDIDHSIPIYAKSKYALVWPDRNPSEDEFRKLLFTIYECDTIPAVSRPPKFIMNTLPPNSAFIKHK